MFSITVYTYSVRAILSWQSLVVSFNLPLMKQTALMESNSFFPQWDYWGGSGPERRSAGELLADVFWIALLFIQEEHKRLFPERDAQHLFDVRRQCSLYSFDEINSWRYYFFLLLFFFFASFSMRIDPTQTRLWSSDGGGLGGPVLVPACTFTQIHPAVFIS